MNISTIIPTYQEENYIEETLFYLAKAKSVAKSNGIESEIIVVDSGYDGTFNIAKRNAKKVFKFKERGVSKARNFGASKSSGDILLFMDADTIVPANFFEEVIKTFRDDGVVGAVSYVLPCKPHSISAFEKLFYKLDRTFIKQCANCQLFLRYYTRCNAVAVRREIFFKVGGFNPQFNIMEVTELILKVSKFGKIAVLRYPVYDAERRIKQWGPIKSYLVWLKNFAPYQLIRRPIDEHYEVVR